ncbi:MAG: ABC transporter ATP-binding protein [Oscillospiraceae bacterium]|nr:ABC transporter ATP-binding protein [Oscillospiraceae bacterium]
MLKLFRYLTRRDWGLMGVSFGFILLQIWLDLSLPDYMSEITELVQAPDSPMSTIVSAGSKMMLCALGSLLAAVVVSVCIARIAAAFGARLRLGLFDRVQAFSMEEIGRFSTASLITRSTNDVTQVTKAIAMGVQVVLKAPLTATWAIVKIANKNWQWTLSTAAAIGILLALVAITMVIVLPKFKRLQLLTDDLNRVTRENLTGIRVVRAYNAEGYQEDKFKAANDTLTKTSLSAVRTLACMMPNLQFVLSGLSLAIYWIGAALINGAGMPAEKIGIFSNMIVFSAYAMQVVMSFIMLVVLFIILPRAQVSAKRIREVMDTKPALHDGDRTDGEEDRRGEVEFRHVSFRYPDAEEDVLHDLSFTVGAGQTLAFIGATGSGKSTAVNLIPRFYDATDGAVLVDGVDVRDYTQEALHNKLGYISQKAVLFGGTIRSNVAYGENGAPAPDDAAIHAAVETAQAAEFVDALDEGLDAFVAQGGTNLSGGQKQRLSIARAICRKPEILIFDDSFSALDYKTDRALRETLDRACVDATRIIVAQRIGTIRDADRIVVLDEGRVAGIGTHKELMATCEVYRDIAYSQLSKEELE